MSAAGITLVEGRPQTSSPSACSIGGVRGASLNPEASVFCLPGSVSNPRRPVQSFHDDEKQNSTGISLPECNSSIVYMNGDVAAPYGECPIENPINIGLDIAISSNCESIVNELSTMSLDHQEAEMDVECLPSTEEADCIISLNEGITVPDDEQAISLEGEQCQFVSPQNDIGGNDTGQEVNDGANLQPEMVANTENDNLNPNPPSREEIKALVQKQIEFFFSRENWSSDPYLVSQMDSDQYVPVYILANCSQFKVITKDHSIILDALKDSPFVQVDEENNRVRPNYKRCIVILREIPETTPVKEIEEIFDGEGCPKLVSCEFVHNDFWYVTFESDIDAQKAYRYLRETVVTFKNKPILARIKTKPISRIGCLSVLPSYGAGNPATEREPTSSSTSQGTVPAGPHIGNSGAMGPMPNTQSTPSNYSQPPGQPRMFFPNPGSMNPQYPAYNFQPGAQVPTAFFYPNPMMQWTNPVDFIDFNSFVQMNGLTPRATFKPSQNSRYGGNNQNSNNNSNGNAGNRRKNNRDNKYDKDNRHSNNNNNNNSGSNRHNSSSRPPSAHSPQVPPPPPPPMHHHSYPSSIHTPQINTNPAYRDVSNANKLNHSMGNLSLNTSSGATHSSSIQQSSASLISQPINPLNSHSEISQQPLSSQSSVYGHYGHQHRVKPHDKGVEPAFDPMAPSFTTASSVNDAISNPNTSNVATGVLPESSKVPNVSNSTAKFSLDVLDSTANNSSCTQITTSSCSNMPGISNSSLPLNVPPPHFQHQPPPLSHSQVQNLQPGQHRSSQDGQPQRATMRGGRRRVPPRRDDETGVNSTGSNNRGQQRPGQDSHQKASHGSSGVDFRKPLFDLKTASFPPLPGADEVAVPVVHEEKVPEPAPVPVATTVWGGDSHKFSDVMKGTAKQKISDRDESALPASMESNNVSSNSGSIITMSPCISSITEIASVTASTSVCSKTSSSVVKSSNMQSIKSTIIMNDTSSYSTTSPEQLAHDVSPVAPLNAPLKIPVTSENNSTQSVAPARFDRPVTVGRGSYNDRRPNANIRQSSSLGRGAPRRDRELGMRMALNKENRSQQQSRNWSEDKAENRVPNPRQWSEDKADSTGENRSERIDNRVDSEGWITANKSSRESRHNRDSRHHHYQSSNHQRNYYESRVHNSKMNYAMVNGDSSPPPSPKRDNESKPSSNIQPAKVDTNNTKNIAPAPAVPNPQINTKINGSTTKEEILADKEKEKTAANNNNIEGEHKTSWAKIARESKDEMQKLSAVLKEKDEKEKLKKTRTVRSAPKLPERTVANRVEREVERKPFRLNRDAIPAQRNDRDSKALLEKGALPLRPAKEGSCIQPDSTNQLGRPVSPK